MTLALPPTLRELRQVYHKNICANLLGLRSGAMSVADRASISSKNIAQHMATAMGFPLCPSPPEGQTLGSRFTEFTRDFLEKSFVLFLPMRPGTWSFSTSQALTGIAAFDQYKHLAQLAVVLRQHPTLTAALGGDYFITPDIIVARQPLQDSEINAVSSVIPGTDAVATHTPLRAVNDPPPQRILHASISCKWSMRSDRAQNTRTEALNLIRNRKGHAPHIVAVTLEPLPTRLASVALGTGDIDCTYHAALYELQEAVMQSGSTDQLDMLNTLIEGRRLRDITDLPLDLVI